MKVNILEKDIIINDSIHRPSGVVKADSNDPNPMLKQLRKELLEKMNQMPSLERRPHLQKRWLEKKRMKEAIDKIHPL